MSAADRIRALLSAHTGEVYAVSYELLHDTLAELVAHERHQELNPLPLPPRPDEPLIAARVGKAKDCRDVKPADLCRTMAHDIETGILKADGVVLVFMDRPEDGPWDCGRYVANMRHDQELVALTLAKEQCIRKWLK